MNQKLSIEQQTFHELALDLSKGHRHLEGQLIEVLQNIDRLKIFKKLGFASLFQYTVHCLGFTESVAYSFINVARKSSEIVQLKTAIQTQTLTVAKASRMAAAVNLENAENLITFAKSHTCRQIDFEVARLNPKLCSAERAKVLSAESVELKITISKESFEKLKRAQTLAAQKGQKNLDLGGTLEALLNEYLKKQDPVVRAKRAQARLERKIKLTKVRQDCAKQKKPATPSQTVRLCMDRFLKHDILPTQYSNRKKPRVPLNARQRHQVFHRDEGRCTFQLPSGQRCNNERWIQLHHLKPAHQGGSNELQNLQTLCSAHHDLTHQLSLPLDGQVNWVRAPRRRYDLSRPSVAP